MNAEMKQDGSTRLVIRNLVRFDAQCLQMAGRGLDAGLKHAATVAMKNYLSGPRPEKLDVVTTRLRGSITSKVESVGEGIIGRIGTNIPYAPVHEFGLIGHAPIKINEHERSTDRKGVLKKSRMSKGKVLSDLYRLDKDGNRIGYKRTLKQLAAKQNKLDQIQTGKVRAHERKNFKYAGRPFLRPALEDSKPVILAEIKRQLDTLANAA